MRWLLLLVVLFSGCATGRSSLEVETEVTRDLPDTKVHVQYRVIW